jgi:hypothetical protein
MPEARPEGLKGDLKKTFPVAVECFAASTFGNMHMPSGDRSCFSLTSKPYDSRMGNPRDI